MFEPVNRYILINIPEPNEEASNLSIILPDDYKTPDESHLLVSAIRAAADVRFNIQEGSKVVVDRSMIEEIKIGGTIYNVILDNYVVGIVG
tara:strand:+ start:483 stop:755 length:273 start_codon:yes stop_codon:yes gene_type:complete